MPDYHEFLMRHGEFGIQAIVEYIESYEGIPANTNIPLEERWVAVMQPSQTTDQQSSFASV